MRNVRERLDVVHTEQWVRRRLDPHELCIVLHRVLDSVEVRGVDEVELEVVLLVHLREDAVGAAVDVVAGDDVIARFEEVEDGVDRAHPRRETAPVLGAFQTREVVLEVGPGRIPGPGVLVAGVLAGRGLRVRGVRVDGRHQCARLGVGLLAGVDGARLESLACVLVLLVHTVASQRGGLCLFQYVRGRGSRVQNVPFITASAIG